MSQEIIVGDAGVCLAGIPDGSVQCCVTSPPYFGLRDYQVAGQIGLEPTVSEYIDRLVLIFCEVRRVLRDDGTLWLNLGDSYANKPVGSFNGGGFKDQSAQTGGRDMSGVATSGTVDKLAASGLKPKDLIGIPWRVAFALQADGWYLRSDIIWAKPNPMPESVTDRPTKAHEYLFLFSKQPRYYYDADAVREEAVCDRMRGPALHPDLVSTNGNDGLSRRPITGQRNLRSVWNIATAPFPSAHFATFPPALVEPCIKAGSKPGDTVLDPFLGAGTTLLVASRLDRNGIGIELNPTYAEMAHRRIHGDAPMFADVALEVR